MVQFVRGDADDPAAAASLDPRGGDRRFKSES